MKAIIDKKITNNSSNFKVHRFRIIEEGYQHKKLLLKVLEKTNCLTRIKLCCLTH